MSSFFVTGTDTNVGKTVVSTILARGLSANYWKPIQTGTCESSDTDFVAKWIGASRVHSESYSFSPPVSPHLAARAVHERIDLNSCTQKHKTFKGATIIEGAGGVMVPINDDQYISDLIAAINLPTIVVASTRLGTINHTLLTLQSLRARMISIAGVVTIGDENKSVSDSIAGYGSVHLIGHIPILKEFTTSSFDIAFKSFNLEMSHGN